MALNALILRPLNIPRAESLFSIHRVSDNSTRQSYPDYLDLRDRNRSFEDLAAYDIAQAGLDTGENSSRVWLYEVSGNYFDVLGIDPYLGRLIHASDEHGPQFDQLGCAGLDRLLADAPRHRFDVLLVAAFDRIARNVRDFLEVLDELNLLGIEFVSFRESIDTGGALGRAMVLIVGRLQNSKEI